MLNSLTDQALRVLAHARDEARSLNHTFVGTEHLLLGLLHGDSGTSAVTMQNLGLDLAAVRVEIEKLVQRGSQPPCTGELPLTPRAQRAIQCAAEEACFVGQKQISAEHLLLGLFREPDGVAGQALRNLGLDLEKLRLESLKLRLMQMTVVERIVRPLHAATPRKRKIREELLAHLETIYEQELARNDDPTAALRVAAQRLGNPSDLTGEFERDLPFKERLSYRWERFFGWRAPESVARWMARVATRLSLIMVPLCGLFLRFGWDDDEWALLRVMAGLLVALWSALLLVILHLKLRDTMWGAFGSRQSPSKAFAWALVMSLVTLASGFGFIALTSWTLTNWTEYQFPYGATIATAAFVPFVFYLHARRNGLTEISDTCWACLDIKRFETELNA